MRTSGFKFDIEKVADLIVREIEDLMTDSIIVANNFGSLKDKFGKVLRLKEKYKLESIDIVFVWKNKGWDELFNIQSYKNEVAEIYNRINYKMSESKVIPTFFRGGIKEAPSFHLPAGLNVWFLTDKQFVESKLKPLTVISFGADLHTYLSNKFNIKNDEELFNEMSYYVIDVNNFFNLDKSIQENWSKK